MNHGAFRRLDPNGKLVVIRHGHAPARARNRQEKAVESQVRQQGKREVRRAVSTQSQDE